MLPSLQWCDRAVVGALERVYSAAAGLGTGRDADRNTGRRLLLDFGADACINAARTLSVVVRNHTAIATEFGANEMRRGFCVSSF